MRSTASASKRGLLRASASSCDRLVAVLGERLEAAVERIAAVVEAHAHGKLFHALLELLGVQIAGAFVEHAAEEVRQPLLAGRILRAAALEGKAHRDQRHAVLLHQPSRDAPWGFDLLNFHGQCSAGGERREGDCERQDQQPGHEPSAGPRALRERLEHHHRSPFNSSWPAQEAWRRSRVQRRPE